VAKKKNKYRFVLHCKFVQISSMICKYFQ